MEHFVYRNERTNQISFPLGGIGTGCIGLAGNGRLIDWEIFNRPNKGSVNGFSHFAIRAENNDEVTDARILHGNLHAPFQGDLLAPQFSTFGWGPRREYLTGLPHFDSVDFRGEFPIAELSYRDDTFPGQVQLTAFNPFIPTNEDDSGIPAAFFEFSVTNTTATAQTYSIVGVLTNPLPANNLNTIFALTPGGKRQLCAEARGNGGGTAGGKPGSAEATNNTKEHEENTKFALTPGGMRAGRPRSQEGRKRQTGKNENREGGSVKQASAWGHALHLSSDSLQPEDTAYGNLTLATDAGLADDVAISWQQNWFRGAWFDNLEVYWKDLNSPGPFENRVYDAGEQRGAGARFTEQDTGLLAVHLPVAAGETGRIRFVISWSFPNCENYWKKEQNDSSTWKNYYATCWQDSMASAQYAIEHWPRLYDETKRFKDALFASTIPTSALDAVSANISILKSPTVLRLEDGTFYGWEGLHPDEGCCEGSCTHVWNYQQALPFLFPALERSMRTADYRYNLLDSGAMPFRIQLPLGSEPSPFRPCCDGQFGGVLKTYRDWKICGDHGWLRSIWPGVKKSLEYAWSPDNIDRWDPDKSGVLTGRQHHTLDMELFGPNSWLTGFYLGALKAASEMAESVGDVASASAYHAIFERGKAWVDANLFNGEYYIQRVDLADRALVESYGPQEDALKGGSALDAYWNPEHNEIKYQIGEGSSIDQVLAQWHASLYGLGDLYDPQQVKQACAAIYKYNFVPDMGQAYNPCRIYSLNDEGGLVICAWPEDVHKPLIPAPYSQETMNGFEYAAACHMIMVGLVDEGMRCIEAIRHRYDGERRNPWNEFECGNNYARSMASYALLNAFSGFQFDMVNGALGFQPVQPGNFALSRRHPRPLGEASNGEFRCFWSLDSGWGQFSMTADQCSLVVLYGALHLRCLHLPFLVDTPEAALTLDGEPVAFTKQDGAIILQTKTRIQAGQTLQVLYS